MPGVAPPQNQLDTTKQQLQGVEDTLDASAQQRRKIEMEVEAVQADRARLSSALMQTAAKVRDLEEKITQSELNLQELGKSEQALKSSLNNRRAVLAEVLAALQRMGRKPPPAILVREEDMLSAIRAAILLGAVLPELRQQAQAMSDDLKEMIKIRDALVAEKDQAQASWRDLTQERMRLDALVRARQANLATAQQALDAEKYRATQLAKEATSLKDLIAKMETDAATADRLAQQQARAAEALRQNAEQEAASITAKAALPTAHDPARLAPAVAFADAKGSVILPVAGEVRKNFGASNVYGGTEKGLSVATHSQASVVAPVDSWVLFSGPWRSYGQILILNAGNGYYIVLAGLEKIDVTVGQFVLGGEPVGSMGNGLMRTAATLAIGADEPILYIEFRKDGAAIDPGPWWVKPSTQKVRG